MKKCPNCSQFFSDDNFFCLNCGASLLDNTDAKQNPTFFQMPNDAPTQVLPRLPTTQTISGNSSKWLYLVIGLLASALAAMGIFMFLAREKDERAVVAANEKTEHSAKSAENASQNGIAVTKSAPQSLPPTGFPANSGIASEPETNPDLTPGGSWSGDWDGKGASYTATADFTETGGKVTGQIVWTLRRTTNPNKRDKIGKTAVEYVQGAFNPQTRMLNLKGVRKDDPNGLVILDRYNLSLSEDSQTIVGKSINGKFILRR